MTALWYNSDIACKAKTNRQKEKELILQINSFAQGITNLVIAYHAKRFFVKRGTDNSMEKTPDVASKDGVITLQDVLHWIVDNCDNTDAMEKINRASFPFTSRYEKHTNAKKPNKGYTPTINDLDLGSDW
jgi:hypothetical protein